MINYIDHIFQLVIKLKSIKILLFDNTSILASNRPTQTLELQFGNSSQGSYVSKENNKI